MAKPEKPFAEARDAFLDWIGDGSRNVRDAALAGLDLVIGDTQFLPGYCVLLVDDPSIDRLTEMPKSQRLEFLESMDLPVLDALIKIA